MSKAKTKGKSPQMIVTITSIQEKLIASELRALEKHGLNGAAKKAIFSARTKSRNALLKLGLNDQQATYSIREAADFAILQNNVLRLAHTTVELSDEGGKVSGKTKTEMIAELNDSFRTNIARDGLLMLSDSVISNLTFATWAAVEKVIAFDDFTSDNDPLGERAFGAFDHEGLRVLWKIDYYNSTMSGSSKDPSDAGQSMRALTITLDSEYATAATLKQLLWTRLT